MVVLFRKVPRGCLQFVIVVFPDHTHLLFFQSSKGLRYKPHELLKGKLFSYGMGGAMLKWIDSFLCFKQKPVVVNGVKSDWAPVSSGIRSWSFAILIVYNSISTYIESIISLLQVVVPAIVKLRKRRPQ